MDLLEVFGLSKVPRKAVICAFDIIGNNLVWKIGIGASVCLGLDPWVGCKWRHLLPSFFIDKFHSVGVFSLKDIGVPGLIPLMEQGWLLADQLGLDDHQDAIVWNGYLSILKRSHVRLTNDNDVLVWNLSKYGLYTPKEGYVQLLLDRDGMDHS